MDLDKSIRISLLNDFYGELLTKRQRKIVEDYFNNNISLGEIGEQLKISRQAVFDSLETATKKLEDFETKLKLLSKYELLNKTVNGIKSLSASDVQKILNVWEN